MMPLRLIVLCLGITFAFLSTRAKVTDPNIYIREYDKLVSEIGESNKSYDYIMAVYKEYAQVIENNNSTYSDNQTAVSGLKWLFPYLIKGAFYYSGQNNQNRALDFAEAYLDTYINPSIRSAGLSVNELYPTLAYFAASNNYNLKNYDKAIKYLDAYIKSGDTKNIKDAFNYTAKSYIHINQPDKAKQVLISGLNLFPADLQMLTTIINMLAETKTDDLSLQKYVTQALRYKPNDIGLLNIQAQLYERSQDFDKATDYYTRLQSLRPNNLDIARHLGINLYNSAIRILNTGGKKNRAIIKLNEAAKVLTDVVVSDPLAVNYIYALANTYSILGDKDNLEKINSRIIALGELPVAKDVTPQIWAVNNEHISPSSIPAVQPVGKSLISHNDGNAGREQPYSRKVSISDVDMDIPVTNHMSKNTFAVIIANNDYKKVSDVANAENDGKIFAEYCNKVLGIPQSHIRSHYNVTYGELLDAIEDIKAIANAKKGNLDVILYYAGHGVPNEQTKSAYILPVDADGKQMRLCYPLGELYSELSAMNANRTLVFLDACFSGATRSANDGMLLSARSVAIDVDPEEVDGKLIIFSATTGDQTALSYDEQHHGMFTYFLLKRLKETKGNTDLGSLADYLTENVSLESQLRNMKQQIPTVTAGNEYGVTSWKNIKLIR